jgi:DNA-binding NarL/FixJ family response regulator
MASTTTRPAHGGDDEFDPSRSRRGRRATDAERDLVPVLVADVYAAARAGIRAAVEPYGFAVVAEAGNASTAMAAAKRERPRVCLIAAEIPGGGFEATRSIAKALPGTVLVLLDEAGSEDNLVAAIEAGASGYLPRAEALARLPDALNAALDGYVMLPLPVMTGVVERAAPGGVGVLTVPGSPPIRFTRREHQVLRMLLDGDSTADIAVALGIAPVTVRRYISDILRKADVADRSQLHALWGPRTRA